MMVEHNAIVVMEDLNFGFKRGRFKVEKQDLSETRKNVD
jgi:CRISPR-associated protein Cpf1